MDSRSYRFLSRFVDIQPQEVRSALLLFSFFFLITAPHTIIKALRYADLLHQIGYQALPFAYLFAATVTGFVVFLFSKIQFKIPLQNLILSSLVFFILTGLVFQLLINVDSDVLSFLFWIWAGVLVVVLMTLFGLTFNEIFNPREAKRLIGFCGSGGILGGTVGGLTGFFLTRTNLGVYLLPLACVFLFSCLFVARAIFIHTKKQKSPFSPEKKTSKSPGDVGFKESYQTVRKNRYLILIAGMVLLAVIVATFIDYQFSVYVQEQYPTEEDKQAFFNLFFGLMTVFAFFFQLLLTSFFLKKTKGIRLTLLMAPLILMTGSFGVLLGAFFASQMPLFVFILIKGGDESLTFSLNQSVREILYIPLPSDLRYKARLFIDMFVSRAAKVIAAVFLFIYGFFFNIFGIVAQERLMFSPALDPVLAVYLSGGILVLTLLWVVLDLRIFKEYVRTIKQRIPPKWIPVDKDLSGKVDLQFTKQIFDTLESKEMSSSLYAMHLYDLLRQNKLTPEFRQMITERINEIKMASLGDLFNAEGASWFPQDIDKKSFEDFVDGIQEILSLEVYQELIRGYADKVMSQASGSEIGRMELAKAIGMMGKEAAVVSRLGELIADESPQVVRYALESAGKLKQEEHLPAIVDKLDTPSSREDAKAALVQYGHAALDLLQRTLEDSKKSLAIRNTVISVLGRIGSQEAADIMMEKLEHDDGELMGELLESLEFLRIREKGIHFSSTVLKRKTSEMIKAYCGTFIELHGPEQKGKHVHLTRQKRLDVLFASIFKLLGLFHEHVDVVKAYQNIKTRTKDSVDYAIELLDNTLDKDVRGMVLPLIVDMSTTARIRRFRQLLENFQAF